MFKTLEEANAEITRLNGLIAQKNQDIIGARRKYKLLNEMTEEEKAALSKEDIAKKQEQDELFLQQQDIQERQMKEINDRRSRLALEKAGGDAELAKKVLANFDMFKDSDKLSTETEIATIMDMAVNLLGDDKPNPSTILSGGNKGGQPPSAGTEEPKVDANRMKAIETTMFGAPIEAPKAGGDGGGDGSENK